MRFHVHDFQFQHMIDRKGAPEDPFFVSVNIYVSFSEHELAGGELQCFQIYACNLSGKQAFNAKMLSSGDAPHPSELDPIACFGTYDEAVIMQFLKENIEGLIGRNERELIMNAFQHFNWEGLNNPEQKRRFFK
ncbi:hypothetical protein [Chitinophaga caseinilytica]|uniref:hypothetical protein n=1 Tax=Chitinophaga caseinilytica TaxID=2267521 RepID=UPI003C2D0024